MGEGGGGGGGVGGRGACGDEPQCCSATMTICKSYAFHHSRVI